MIPSFNRRYPVLGKILYYFCQYFYVALIVSLLDHQLFFLLCRNAKKTKTSILTCAPNKISNQLTHPNNLAIQNTPNRNSDKTARMRRLIRIFAEHTCAKVCLFSDVAAQFNLVSLQRCFSGPNSGCWTLLVILSVP